MKRLFDICCAALGLVLLSPLFAIVAWLIYRQSGRPIFYRQTRIGRHGRPFRIWKFRTMVVNADQLGPSLTTGRDARITPVGRGLRKFKLDELPQLLNVITGEMSLVGPRPEVAEYVDLYSVEERETLKLRPGITDPASLEYFCEQELLDGTSDPQRTYIEEIMPAKLRINRQYAARANVFADVAIIARTVLRIVGIGSGTLKKPPTESFTTQTRAT